MNARLMKEARELRPLLAGMLGLIIVPYLIWNANAELFGYLAFGVGCAVLAGWAFGHEFHHRTVSLLLSQPIARRVLWQEKMLVLGVGLVTSLAAVAACYWVYCPLPLRGTLGTLALMALCAFCGVPCFTLLHRNALAGMASAVGVPALILVGNGLLTARWVQDSDVRLISSVYLLLLYCAGALWWGYAQFMRLEAYDTPGRELSLPAGVEAVLARRLGKVSARFDGAFATLLKKELRVQQVSFLLAGIFAVVGVVGFCLLPLHRGLAEGVLGGDFGVFVVILPLIAGAIAVAEEKGWGLAEWQLTLPPSAWQQWTAKTLITLGTSLTLGLLLPAAMFAAGYGICVRHVSWENLPSAFDVSAWVLAQLLVTSVAMYAASFARNTVWAILAALAIIGGGFSVFGLTGKWMFVLLNHWGFVPGRSPLNLVSPVLLACLVLMLCLLQGLAWSNFRRFGARADRLVVQFVVVFLVIGGLSLALVSALCLA